MATSPVAHDPPNQVGQYAADVLKSERARTESTILASCKDAIQGSAIYLPAWLDAADAKGGIAGIIAELKEHVKQTEGREVESLEDTGLVAWSKHLKHEDPTFSPSFRALVKKLEKHFDCDAFATRLNVYRDGSDWKPMHHDSHAFHKGAGNREDFTMGLSLGCTRALEFQHVDSGLKFGFPQKSGDVFAFSSVANKLFQHGIPKGGPQDSLRVSIIAWGRRRQLTTRNSSVSERENEPRRAVAAPLCECGCRDVKKPAALRETEPNAAKGKAKKKSRLQNGIGKK
ncbi:hypothetical protein DIPPA_10823 [Diplonema papillatum]|nr:hypothetical protein DIPPA_10823 [Diplonema papillatum]